MITLVVSSTPITKIWDHRKQSMVNYRLSLWLIKQKMVFRLTPALIIVKKKVSRSSGWCTEALVAAVILTAARVRTLTAVLWIAYKERMTFNPSSIWKTFFVHMFNRLLSCHTGDLCYGWFDFWDVSSEKSSWKEMWWSKTKFGLCDTAWSF